jgi:hypothetical protein
MSANNAVSEFLQTLPRGLGSSLATCLVDLALAHNWEVTIERAEAVR